MEKIHDRKGEVNDKSVFIILPMYLRENLINVMTLKKKHIKIPMTILYSNIQTRLSFKTKSTQGRLVT